MDAAVKFLGGVHLCNGKKLMFSVKQGILELTFDKNNFEFSGNVL